jgi:hypothetical protein
VQRRSGEITSFNAGDAVAAVIDIFREQGVPLAPSIRARLGKGAKALLEAEFQPSLVVAACVVAIRTGWFGSVETIAQEMAVAQAGSTISRSEFQAALAETTHKIETSESRVWQLMREDAARRSERSTP